MTEIFTTNDTNNVNVEQIPTVKHLCDTEKTNVFADTFLYFLLLTSDPTS